MVDFADLGSTCHLSRPVRIGRWRRHLPPQAAARGVGTGTARARRGLVGHGWDRCSGDCGAPDGGREGREAHGELAGEAHDAGKGASRGGCRALRLCARR